MDLHSAQFNTPNIHASDAILVLHSSTNINAPASLVFRTLRNTETWRDWNRFVPKVNITYQPPEKDMATAEEISALVRNTSITGSFYSDLTDGGYGVRREKDPEEQPPPRFRLNSLASQGSDGSDSRRISESVDPFTTTGASSNTHRGSVASIGSNTAGAKSGAQRFQEAQESRRASIASGEKPSPVVNQIENASNRRASLASQTPGSPASAKGKDSKAKQTVYPSARSAQRAHEAFMAMYGEPSVRLQIKTKMTMFVRMKAYSPSEYTETNMVVTDVSRPDDPVEEKGTTALTRSKTHNLERSGMYRVVWAGDHEGTSLLNVSSILKGNKFPKSLMQAERVHEIEPIDSENCIYRTWECQKGHAAKTVKKKYGDYLQKMFEVWASGLRDFCEGLHAPKIDRRDFSISADEAPVVMQTFAY